LGRFLRRRREAFLAGVLSHVPLDMLPHFDSATGPELTTAALGLLVVAGLSGPKSSEFWGALGGVLPDIEVALKNLGLLGEGCLLFPTHRFEFLHGGRFGAPLAQPLFWGAALFSLLWWRFGRARPEGRRG